MPTSPTEPTTPDRPAPADIRKGSSYNVVFIDQAAEPAVGGTKTNLSVQDHGADGEILLTIVSGETTTIVKLHPTVAAALGVDLSDRVDTDLLFDAAKTTYRTVAAAV